MPNKALKIGSAAAAGVDSFLKSFMYARQMKEQEKLQKNAFIVQMLTKQLEDETLPMYKRAKIIDSIPQLVGIKKMDRNLSEMLGLSAEYLDEEVEQTPEVKGKEGTPEKDFVDTSVIPNGEMATSVRLRGTQATSDIPEIKTKRGELTPALIRKRLILETKKAEDEQDIEKQTKLLKINYELQMKSLKATGFTKEVFRGYDRNGNYIVTMVNQNGERKDIFLGDVDSEAIEKAKISTNKPSRVLQERERYWLNQTNPETGMNYSEEEANVRALEDINKQFQIGLKAKQAYATSVEQGVTGTKPIQPAQAVDDNRAIAERRATLRANISTVRRQAQDASIDASNKSKQATDQWNNVVEPIKQEMQKLVDSGVETSDIQYTTQQARLNTEINRYNDLKRAADDAVSRDKSLRDSVTEAENILSGYESEIGATTSSTITDKIGKAINVVRKNNPDATKSMSDEDIINYLRKKGKIK